MLDSQQIGQIVEELLDLELQFLVDVKTSSSKIRQKITVLIDTDEGIGIADCSRISRELGDRLEELIDDAYTLEVSSPGLDTPLKIKRQYHKNIGKSLKVITLDGQEIKGELLEAGDLEITVLPEKKKKEKKEPEKINLAFENIKEARVQVTFN
ncbi:ribosome assembly cofactor RimP [Arcticibacterium luteifluviistationis]|uniref:Ribosome maturation factor RimP n=2 Tax=Arcticibacterium luteifluviistationis TaxID=1784714 RepID=A0A2Z4GB92_9BACT|nr:ribosome assembly cofactor RimP [Arcticibacterium luteifluviistationis]